MNPTWDYEVFYPGKNNKWLNYKTKKCNSFEKNGYWANGDLWYNTHFTFELRDKRSPIPVWYREQYKPNKQKAKLESI